jgi:hypothetical protein
MHALCSPYDLMGSKTLPRFIPIRKIYPKILKVSRVNGDPSNPKGNNPWLDVCLHEAKWIYPSMHVNLNALETCMQL